MADPFGYMQNQKRGSWPWFDGTGWIPGEMYGSPAYLAVPQWIAAGYPTSSGTLTPHNTTAGDLTGTRIFPGGEDASVAFMLDVGAAGSIARIFFAGNGATKHLLDFARSTATLEYYGSSGLIFAARGSDFWGADSFRFGAVPVNFYNDSNFQMDITSSNPRLTLDSGDYVEYDRTNNRYDFYIGSSLVARIDSTGFVANLTRRIPLVPLQLAGVNVTWANDTHGTLGQGSNLTPHLDFADGVAHGFVSFAPVPVPYDFASNMKLVFVMSSSVGGNNINLEWVIDATDDQDDTTTSLLINGSSGQAMNATANKTTKFASGNFTPTVGSLLAPGLGFDRTAGADTNTGTVTLWNSYLEYTAVR